MFFVLTMGRGSPPLYRNYHPVVHVIWNTIYIILGLWIYPIHGIIPILPLVVGIVIGLYISRSGKTKASDED